MDYGFGSQRWQNQSDSCVFLPLGPCLIFGGCPMGSGRGKREKKVNIPNINNLLLLGDNYNMGVNHSTLNFGATTTGPTTDSQILLINRQGDGSLNWTLWSTASWIQADPTSGKGSGVVDVWANPTGLGPGSYSGQIFISDPSANNSPLTVDVSYKVYGTGSTMGPMGGFDTPVDGLTVSGSIAVTGWALDDVGVWTVKIYCGDSVASATYIGDANLVEGARPDIEAAYPGYPNNYKAGWGFTMLTNLLPGGGNGTFYIIVKATDMEGIESNLGTKTIICDNANAVKPFGAIDTPQQGGTASGKNFVNSGWVLTPQPNSIPTDGSTINVYVDDKFVGHPTYNVYREDIKSLFPDYANSNGAGAYFYLDTTAYTNGVHTIQWTATDSGNNTDGIGSRYFTIQNAGE